MHNHNVTDEAATLVGPDAYSTHPPTRATSKRILILSYGSLALAFATLTTSIFSRVKTGSSALIFLFRGLALIADIASISICCITLPLVVLAIVARTREASFSKIGSRQPNHPIYSAAVGGLWAAWVGVVVLNGLSIQAQHPEKVCSVVQGLNVCKTVNTPGVSYPHLATTALSAIEAIVLYVMARMTVNSIKETTFEHNSV